MTTTNRSSDRLPRARSETPRDMRAQTPDSLALHPRPAVPSWAHYFDSKLKLMPGVTIPLRAMLVAGREPQILISPVATSEEAALAAAAPVVLAAPSLLHHRFLEAALERYHPVALWGPPGLIEKKPELVPMHVF